MSDDRSMPPGGPSDRTVGWWRAVVERSSDLVVAIDAHGLITYVSPAVAPMLGWTPADLVGTDGTQFVHPEDRSRITAALAALIRHEGANQQTFRFQHRDGSWRHLEVRATDHLEDPEVGAVLASFRDVTDRVVADEALAARDASYRQAIETTRDAILIADDGVIIQANPAAVQLLGLDRGDALIGRHLADLCEPHVGSGHPDDLWATGTEHRLSRADGGIDVELTTIPTTWDRRPATQFTLRDITVRREQSVALLHQATHDPLTGLPNRSLLTDRLQHAASRAARTQRSFAVLFVDLDRFKVVNDTLGHEVGDELLRQIGSRLTAAVRPGDTVARLGGDEFVVVVEDLVVADTVDQVVERIQAAFEEPFSIRERDFLINASIGVLVTADAADPKSLLRDADAAMYSAKTQGRGRAVRFDATLRDRASRFEDVERRLRAAVDEQQLRVAVQPVLRLSDRRTVGVEALMRWEHPDLGPLLPESFLEVAEETGILPDLGAQVLEATCAHLARWRSTGTGAETSEALWASVNISHGELLNPGFAETVLEALDRHRLPGHALCLDVAERALLADPLRALDALRPAREAGVALAVDDFGTGYASLTALRRFSPEHVKIDRGYVHGMSESPGDAALVRAVVQTGHALGISVIAEGVELVEQQHLLTVLGCDLSQGFLHGRPVPIERFEPHAP